ncbi:hypothetical protein AKL17_3p0034 (plasmid) [Frigidibacter mobilis]|uniref:Uncharacterized protein n=1 Tax=Frigidibacter mobilis TaxID=1335048 RepID=A0A159ZBA0_9RHOB|nr:hypothetical protein AKL17_3p0034 [Frigidibacter mobilis]
MLLSGADLAGLIGKRQPLLGAEEVALFAGDAITSTIPLSYRWIMTRMA